MTAATIILYFFIVAAIAWFSYRRIHGSTDEYYVAGRTLGTFVNSWAFLASLASGGTVMAGVGTAVTLGIPYGLSLTAGAVVGFVVAAVLVARPLRDLGRYTVPDYFRARYRSRFMMWSVPIIIMIGSIAYIVAQLKAAAIVAEYALGWDYRVGVVVTGLVFIAYVSMGGFLAVSWNDLFQGILMFCSIVGFGLVILLTVNSYTDTWNASIAKFPSLGTTGEGTDIPSYIGGFLTWATAISVLPHVIMRVYSAKDVKSAKVSLNTSMLIYAAIILVLNFILVGAVSAVSAITVESGDEAFFLLAEHFIHPLLQGVVAATILAAVMSTTAGLLMVCNAAISHDIYARILRPEAPQTRVVRVGGVSTVVVGVVSILLTLDPPDLLIVLYTAAVAFMASAFFFPMVLGMWWKRCTDAGGVAGLSVGAVVFAAAFISDMPSSSEILLSLPASALATIVASLLTRPADDSGEDVRVEGATDVVG